MSQMINVLLWNACLAGGLAVVVFLAQRIRYLRNQPHVCHALWLLVLLKIVTPPLFAVPVSVDSTRSEQFPDDLLAVTSPAEDGARSVRTEPLRASRPDGGTLLSQTAQVILTSQFAFAVSVLGSFALLLGSHSRVRRIGRLVRHAEPAPRWMQDVAFLASQRLRVKRVPSVRIVNGTISPFLWASSRGPLIVLPGQLMTAVEPEGTRLIIQHEMSHYARRDHWTNTFATVLAMLFWWNPVVWWARRELRIHQESCCDGMVLAHDISQRVRYAETLLKAVDFVASNDASCPSPATTFGSCDTLKRRVEMIVSQNPIPIKSRWVRTCVLVCGLVVLPLGMTNAQDYDAVEKRLGNAVAKGEINLEQAQVMMEALRRSAHRVPAAARMREGVEHRINEIKQLVESGEMSRKEGTRLIEETRRFLRKATERDPAARRMREGVEHRINEIKELVERGEMSREEGARLIEETRRALEKVSDRDAAARKKRYAEMEGKIKAAVKEGDLSPEAAEEKLIAARQDIFGDRARDEDIAARNKRYAEIEREIDRAVQEGKLSLEDAEKKLIAARQEIFQD